MLDFQLNDLTDLPNAPEELARIAYLSATYKQQLLTMGVEVLPANDKLDSYLTTQSATYLFDNVSIHSIIENMKSTDKFVDDITKLLAKKNKE